MTRFRYTFQAREKTLHLGEKTALMGVVNVTPDSFSDGGRFIEADKAIEHCLKLVDNGADIIDIGGESTRPGSQPTDRQTEANRILPIIEEVSQQVSTMISVDTYKSDVAREALQCGADIINDISAFRLDPAMPETARQAKAGVILMHMRGIPATMHTLSPSPDILEELCCDLQVAVNTAYESHIPRGRIIVDPGIGFGKDTVENLQIINRLSLLQQFDLPILVGPSRKRFLGEILDLPVDKRLLGTATAAVVSVLNGAHILRVHDVRELKQVTKIVDSILMEKPEQ